jgi:hypothetical protein
MVVEDKTVTTEIIAGYVKSVTDSEILVTVIGSSKNIYNFIDYTGIRYKELRTVTLRIKDNIKVNTGWELYAFNIVMDDNLEIIDWSLENIENYMNVYHLVAILSNGQLLAENGFTYDLYKGEFTSFTRYGHHIEYLTKFLMPHPEGVIKLYAKDEYVFGISYDSDYRKYYDELDYYKDVFQLHNERHEWLKKK